MAPRAAPPASTNAVRGAHAQAPVERVLVLVHQRRSALTGRVAAVGSRPRRMRSAGRGPPATARRATTMSRARDALSSRPMAARTG
jgi:hypothetical protein